VVLAKKKGDSYEPYKVLTGSTNWTRNGLFTQANNAVILDDKDVAAYYFKEWQMMCADCVKGKGTYGKAFKDYNSTVKTNTKGDIRTWFTPTKAKADMQEAMNLINGAKQGILFLMFKPGSLKSAVLYNAIYERTKKQNAPFIAGVINADPGGKETPTIQFLDKGKKQNGDMTLLTPTNIKKEFGFWKTEPAPQTVTIHAKTVVIDPFGDDPIVICGSHNMGNKASQSNDDNLNIIRGNKLLAETFAVNMLALYHHYRWRFYRAKVTDKKGNELDNKPKWKGLVRHADWQDWYKTGWNKKESDFWLG
jgi:phosphatidylserine/phosphatidylglycerophosphate/cardiolipin synthase-like enzyme